MCVGKSDEKRYLIGHKIYNDPFSLGRLIVGVGFGWLRAMGEREEILLFMYN